MYDVLLLNSGGFDSTTLFYDLMNAKKRVLSLFFEYGQNNMVNESNCVVRMCHKFNQDYKIITLPVFDWSKATIDKNVDAPANGSDEYIEMRNLIFLSYAVSIAESYGIPYIHTAVIKSMLGFKDTQPKLFESLNETIKECGIKVVTPYIELTKENLGLIARRLKIKKHDFFSCHYPESEKPCGKCDKCLEIDQIYDKVINDTTIFKTWVSDDFKFSDRFFDMYMKQPINELRLLINNKCNCNCDHCFYGFKNMTMPELTYDKKMDVVKQAIALGASNIHISGKEPLINEEVFKYISDIKSFNPAVGVDLVTNGLTLKKFADKLRKSKLDRICLSIDSTTSEGVRGSNKHVIDQLKLLRLIGKKVSIFIALHIDNYRNILNTIHDCMNEGITDFYVVMVRPLGNGEALQKKLLTLEEVNFVYNELIKIKNGTITFALSKTYVQPFLNRKIPNYEFENELEFMLMTDDYQWVTENLVMTGEFYCHSFSGVITLTPDGYVLGCATEVANPHYHTTCSSGNVRNYTLSELITKGRNKSMCRLRNENETQFCYHHYH